MPRSPLTAVRCTDIVPTRVAWLWEPYLARGKMAVLDGDPGMGKSLATIDIAARITRGSPFPGGSARREPAAVLFLNAEDDATDTIQPRVVAAGGDPDRVHVLAAPGLGSERLPQFPDDTSALEDAVRDTRAALVVIDPMMAFFPPTVSANNDQCIRTALSPLAAVAAATGACVLLVRHMRKAAGGHAIHRGAGSVGIVGAVRSGLVVACHPDDAELRVMAVTKSNLGPPGPSLGFRLRRGGPTGQSFVEWAGPIDLTADDLCGAGAPVRAGRQCRTRAAEWLRAFLAGGPRRATDIQAAAVESGITWRTLERVKGATGVKSDPVRQGKTTEWWWRDPRQQKHRTGGLGLEPLDELASIGELGGGKR
jgi:hypothetical protein